MKLWRSVQRLDGLTAGVPESAAHLADNVIGQQLRRHVRDGAAGARLDARGALHLPRQPEICHLGCDAQRRVLQQDKLWFNAPAGRCSRGTSRVLALAASRGNTLIEEMRTSQTSSKTGLWQHTVFTKPEVRAERRNRQQKGGETHRALLQEHIGAGEVAVHDAARMQVQHPRSHLSSGC